MPTCVRFDQTGGPDVLAVRDEPQRPPGPGEALLRQTAIGVNFIDTYHRSGLYPVDSLPSGLGSEAAGTVLEVGEGVPTALIGKRVAYAGGKLGAYADERCVPASRLVPLPDNVSDKVAAASLLKGMTAEYLILRSYSVKPQETVVFHAAAGGVGLIACQWLRHLGATVIGTVGSEAKAELAREHGCHHVVVLGRDPLVERVREITKGEGASVVYDGIGKDTFQSSLDCLRPRGMMVSFGNASGPPPLFNILELSTKGSLYLTRPNLAHYTRTEEELRVTARHLFEVITSGAVKVHIGRTFALEEASEAHRALESRGTVGSTLLIPKP